MTSSGVTGGTRSRTYENAPQSPMICSGRSPAVLLGLLEHWGATVLGVRWQDVFAFAVLVVVLMFRPTGLLGESLGKARA